MNEIGVTLDSTWFDNCVFVLRTVKKILITAISENSSFLAKSLVAGVL